jgi:hypothetical protein
LDLISGPASIPNANGTRFGRLLGRLADEVSINSSLRGEVVKCRENLANWIEDRKHAFSNR